MNDVNDEMQQQMGLSLLLPRVDRIYALMPMPKKGLNLSFLGEMSCSKLVVFCHFHFYFLAACSHW